jgi:glycosyltransferase involved in cell wall biosynthesis
MQNVIRETKSSERIIFVPMQYDVYPKILRRCGFAVLWNSPEDEIEIPNEAIEIIACNVPLFTLKGVCIGEIVDQGVNGYICESEEELRNIIRKTLIDKVVTVEENRKYDQHFGNEWRKCFAKIMEGFDVCLRSD